MTRINLVDPKLLADQHLMTEFYEIIRVPTVLKKSLNSKSIGGVLRDIPDKFTLNTGHVKFFYDKMNFLVKRYEDLTNELFSRGFDVTEKNPKEIFERGVPEAFKAVQWNPSKDEIQVSVERLLLRINEKPSWYRYYGDPTIPCFFEILYKSS
jgi:deoxyribonuclease (pyrimidine dimer)